MNQRMSKLEIQLVRIEHRLTQCEDQVENISRRLSGAQAEGSRDGPHQRRTVPGILRRLLGRRQAE